jgi:SAM-dependent methyltransferase
MCDDNRLHFGVSEVSYPAQNGGHMTEKPAAYETMAARYAANIDTKPHNAYYDRPAMLSLLPDVSGKKVLDAGCGPGVYAQWLVEHGAQVLGLDASPQMVELTRQRVGDRAQFRVTDLSAPLDFLQDATFDMVLSALTISYIADLNALFAEFARALRPAGLFVFSTHHPMSDFQYHGGNYFETAQVTETWNSLSTPDMPFTVTFYRRSLTAITEALWQTGFVMERLIEPLPTPEFEQADPKNYAKLMNQPGFIAIRARRDTI